MTPQPPPRDHRLEVSTLIEARPETVFAILSDPGRFSDWIGGTATFEPRAESPLQIRFPQFETVIEGRVLEVVEGERIAFSWGVSEGRQATLMPAGSTRVEIRLEPVEEGTRVTLAHSGLPSDEEATRHEAGWRFHLSRLSLFANRADLQRALGPTLQAWFEAWNEPEVERRTRLLGRACEGSIRFRDEYATLEGRERLALHIGNTRHHLPGRRVERDGEVRICRGRVLVPWRIVDEGGEVAFRGTDHARVSPAGLLREVTGFWET